MTSNTPAFTTPLIRTIIRLWCHECSRVFADRMIGEHELWFSTTLRGVALENFCERLQHSPDEGEIFADFLTS